MAVEGIHAGMTMGQALVTTATRFPDREALVFEEQRLTYREFAGRAVALAGGLCALGLQKGEHVATLLPNSVEAADAFFGVGEAGCVLVPLNPLFRAHELRHILYEAEIAAVILRPEFSGNELLKIVQSMRAELPMLRHVIAQGDKAGDGTVPLGALYAPGAQSPCDRSGPDDLFGLMYTSGTTGSPKAVMHTHRSLIAPLLATEKVRPSSPTDPSLQRFQMKYGARMAKWQGRQLTLLGPAPLHLMNGYMVMLGAVLNGNRTVLVERFHPVQVLELIEREQINQLTCPPSSYAALLAVRDFDRYDKSSLTYCVVSTAPCPPALARRIVDGFGAPLMIAFGATETGGATTGTRLWDADDISCETVGQPFPGAEVKIVDTQRQPLPAGEVGELVCRLSGIMKGYYKAPEATAEVLDAEGWYYTGDLAVADEAGHVRIVGRKRDMIIRGGQNVFPLEIENYLLTMPEIQAVAVVGVPGRLETESVWAFVVPQPGANLTPKDVVGFCRGKIAPYKVPEEVRIVDSLPVNPLGKVQRFVLRESAIGEREQHRHPLLDAPTRGAV